MKEVKISDKTLQKAAAEGMDAFVNTFINAINEAIGGELGANNMKDLNSEQITLLAYHILQEEVMDGGFIQLIHNGYGGFIFHNPFAKMMRLWGLDDLAKIINKAHKLYDKYHERIEKECSDEEFMAMFEQMPEFDDIDDNFVENEEKWTEQIACYIDEHIQNFVTII
ncbi:MAG: DMP19 family protein [Prevotella sp.]|nr:DMP19 family protein [Prevotella sp.]